MKCSKCGSKIIEKKGEDGFGHRECSKCGEFLRECPKCKNDQIYELVDGGGAMVGICSNCGALVSNSPFYVEVLSGDARERFSECSSLDVKAWKVRK